MARSGDALGRAAPQQRKEHFLLELQVRLEAVAQDRRSRARDGPVEIGQAVGEALQQIAQLELERVILRDEGEWVGSCRRLRVRWRFPVASSLLLMPAMTVISGLRFACADGLSEQIG